MRAIDCHPQRNLIVDALLRGDPDAEIVAVIEPKLSTKTLQRYRNGPLKDAIQKANERRLARQKRQLDLSVPQDRGAVQRAVSEGEDPFLSRLMERKARRDCWLRDAEGEKDWRALAALDRTEFQDVEFEAKLVGRFDSTVPATNTMVILLAGELRQAPAPSPIPDAEIIDITPVQR